MRRKARGPSRWTALVACALQTAALGTSRRAEADAKLQGVGETSVGYTDNIQSAPDVPIPGGAARSGGAFVLLSPGVVLALTSRRYVQRFSYAYTFEFFLASTEASTSSNQLAYRAFFDVSPRVGLVVGASATESNRYSAIVLTAPGAGAVNALPAGSGSFLSATLDELLSFDVALGWRAYEGAGVIGQTPLFDTVAPRTFAPGARVGVERSWESDAAGVEARADYSVIIGSLRPDGTPAGEQRQIVGTGVGVWRHDWGRSFTSRIEAGALRVQRLNTGRGFWAPAGTAALAYVTEFGDAEATYTHAVTTNPLLGQTLLIDEVRLRGALPLTKEGGVLVAGSSGYQQGRILDEDARPAAHVDAILVDVAVGWLATKSLLLGLRYQHTEQISDTRVPPLPLSFVRNTIMVGATLRFPPESDMPKAYRAPRRVDRSDEIRDVIEPAPGDTRGRPGGPAT